MVILIQQFSFFFSFHLSYDDTCLFLFFKFHTNNFVLIIIRNVHVRFSFPFDIDNSKTCLSVLNLYFDSAL